MPTSVLLAVLAAAGLLALAPALVRRYDATERLAAERAQSTARVLDRTRRRRTVPIAGRSPFVAVSHQDVVRTTGPIGRAVWLEVSRPASATAPPAEISVLGGRAGGRAGRAHVARPRHASGSGHPCDARVARSGAAAVDPSRRPAVDRGRPSDPLARSTGRASPHRNSAQPGRLPASPRAGAAGRPQRHRGHRHHHGQPGFLDRLRGDHAAAHRVRGPPAQLVHRGRAHPPDLGPPRGRGRRRAGRDPGQPMRAGSRPGGRRSGARPRLGRTRSGTLNGCPSATSTTTRNVARGCAVARTSTARATTSGRPGSSAPIGTGRSGPVTLIAGSRGCGAAW